MMGATIVIIQLIFICINIAVWISVYRDVKEMEEDKQTLDQCISIMNEEEENDDD